MSTDETDSERCGRCGHDAVCRHYYDGVLYLIRCSACGSQPIDWLRNAVVYPAAGVGGADQ